MRKMRLFAPIAALLMMTACAFMLADCSNIFAEPSEAGTSDPSPDSFGAVQVSVSLGAARTAMPTPTLADFARLEYWFAKGGAAAVKKDAVGNLFFLEEGSYTLTVKAYFADTDESPAAEGASSSFSVSAAQTVIQTVSVALRPIVSEGNGSLSFTLSYPATAAPATLTLIPLIEGDPITLTGTPASVSGTTTLTGSQGAIPSGYYFLQIVVAKADYTSVSTREVVHIYQNLTTDVRYTFADAEFIPTLGGSVAITGTTTGLEGAPQRGDILTADISGVLRGIEDPTYQWIDADTGVNIAEATNATHTVSYRDAGRALAVTVSYDNGDLTSEPTAPVYLAPIGSMADLNDYAAALGYMTGGSVDNPLLVPLALTFTTGSVQGSEIAWADIKTALGATSRYLTLDLSASTAVNNTIAGSGSPSNNDFNIIQSIIKGIILPDNLTSIGEWTFSGCSDLTSVIIPGSVASIGNGAFNGCSGLSSVIIPDNLISIGGSAFSNCTGLTSVTIPDNLTSIGNGAFNGCSDLTSVSIPGSVASIEDFAFYNCSSLISVSIGEGVASIGVQSFYNCSSLTSVSIPESVISIENNAFERCSDLRAFTVAESNAAYSAQDGILYNKAKTTIINVPLMISGALNLPDTLSSIEASAFNGCRSLTSVIIPESVTSISSSAFSYSGLTSVTIPGSVTSISSSAFSYSALASVTITGSITSTVVQAFSGLTSYALTIGDGITSIGASAFENCHLNSVIIPSSVISIGEDAFKNCSTLTSVIIPDSVASIGASAFEDCVHLTSVTITEGVISIGESAFSGCTNLTSVSIPGSVTTIGASAFSCINLWAFTVAESNAVYSAQDGILYNKAKTTIIQVPMRISGVLNLPDTLTSIGEFAFASHRTLTSVSIPSSVVSIGASAFQNCTGLSSVIIPGSVTSIGATVFSGCTSLTSVTITGSITSTVVQALSGLTGYAVTIGAGITSIGTYAFRDCTGLTSVIIPVGVTSIGGAAFQDCTDLTSVSIPGSVSTIGEYAFYGCSRLTSMIIPEGVITIGYYAFYGCTRLTNVSIPEGVTSIGERTFYGCSALPSVTIPGSVTGIGMLAFQNCNVLTTVIFGAESDITSAWNANSFSTTSSPSGSSLWTEYTTGSKAGTYTRSGATWTQTQ
jgi:hypothetical protein